MKTTTFTLASALICATALAAGSKEKFTDTFTVDKAELASVGTNRFFVLAPGFQLVLEGKEKGKPAMLTITVLNDTKLVDGVETRVVEEKETVNGQPVETSRNYFAISRRTGDVFYFGEDVDMYKGGKVTSHDGAWLSGVNDAHFGLAIPGTPRLGARYYQELAPKVAMDRAEIVSLTETFTTLAGKFENCLKTEETSALESAREKKIYAPGIGLIYDGGLKLSKYGYPSK
ncbi:MAG: hypothetical protein HY298_11330 [Verrucomicrobia bacterium]|nr:hypothetical protein [Verrucomicrobiota bacterium]